MTPETEQARAWRRAMGLTMDQLSEFTGYSREAIFLFERGQNSQGKPHAPYAWRRYKLACLAVMFLRHYKIPDINSWQWSAK
jgi:transcriptional regulator with XRE-family HTH domain